MHVKPGDTDEKMTEMVQNLQAYDPNSESLTVEEARELVQRSVLAPFWKWNFDAYYDEIFIFCFDRVGLIFSILKKRETLVNFICIIIP